MARVLVVDDADLWQELHRLNLERILGEGNVDIADNFEAAVSLVDSNDYDAYILDGQFPRTSAPIEHLGIPLAKYIAEKEGSYDKIRIVSGNSPILDEAQKLGIVTYGKGEVNEELGYRNPTTQLVPDIKKALGL